MKRWPLIATVVLTALFVAAFSWFTIGSFHKLNIHRFDLGNVEQVVWNVVHGHGLTMTDPYGTATVSRFAFHVDPFLALLALPYAVWPSTVTLLIIQVLAVGSGIVAAYFLGRHIIGRDWAGLVAAALYVGSATVQWTTIFPIHAVTFALPMTLWMVVAALKKRWWWMLSLGVLIALTKEQAGLSVALFGLWLLFVKRQRRWGLVMTVVPLLWSAVAMFVLIPAYRGATTARAEVYSTTFGSDIGTIISTAVKHPGGFIRTVVSRTNIGMVGRLLSTTGGLSLGNPLALAAAPDVLINALSAKPQQHELKFQYNDLVYPWLLIGTLLTWAMIERRATRWPARLVRGVLSAWVLGWCAVSAYAFGPLPGTPNDRLRFVTWRNEYVAPVSRVKEIIPATASVSATNNLGAQFAQRERLYTFPNVGGADFVLVWERHGSAAVATDAEVAAKLAELRADPTWQALVQTGELTVLRRQP